MKRKLVAVSLAMSVGAGFTLEAVAQAKPDVLVKQRKAAMTLQGKYIGSDGRHGAGQDSVQRQGSWQRNAGLSRGPEQDALGRLRSEHERREERGASGGVGESRAGFKKAAEGTSKAKQRSSQPGQQERRRGGGEGAESAATGKACGACHERVPREAVVNTDGSHRAPLAAGLLLKRRCFSPRAFSRAPWGCARRREARAVPGESRGLRRLPHRGKTGRDRVSQAVAR